MTLSLGNLSVNIENLNVNTEHAHFTPNLNALDASVVEERKPWMGGAVVVKNIGTDIQGEPPIPIENPGKGYTGYAHGRGPMGVMGITGTQGVRCQGVTGYAGNTGYQGITGTCGWITETTFWRTEEDSIPYSPKVRRGEDFIEKETYISDGFVVRTRVGRTRGIGYGD